MNPKRKRMRTQPKSKKPTVVHYIVDILGHYIGPYGRKPSLDMIDGGKIVTFKLVESDIKNESNVKNVTMKILNNVKESIKKSSNGRLCSCGKGNKMDGEYYCEECIDKNPFLCS